MSGKFQEYLALQIFQQMVKYNQTEKTQFRLVLSEASVMLALHHSVFQNIIYPERQNISYAS